DAFRLPARVARQPEKRPTRTPDVEQPATRHQRREVREPAPEDPELRRPFRRLLEVLARVVPRILIHRLQLRLGRQRMPKPDRTLVTDPHVERPQAIKTPNPRTSAAKTRTRLG